MYVLLLTGTLFFSCMSPHDPSAYTDEDIHLKDTGKMDEFVTPVSKHESSGITEVINQPIYEARIFSNEPAHKGFGYDILVDGIVKFHQTNIPSQPGNDGFFSREKAKLTAEFVIEKLKQNIMPPTVTGEELDSLGVIGK
jgi:hypothetical protein